MNKLIIKELYRAALLSKLANLTPVSIESSIKNNNIFSDIRKLIVNTNLNFIQYNNTKCYIFRHVNIIYIAISSPIVNHGKLQLYRDKIYIDNYILEQYNQLESQIHKRILELDIDKHVKYVYICGYNSGGAICTFFAAVFAEKYRNMYLVSCYTFDTPTVGNKHFKDYFNKYVTRSYRTVLENDEIISKQYQHVSPALQLNTDSIIEISEEPKKHTWIPVFNCITESKRPKYAIGIDIYIDRLYTILTNIKIPSAGSGTTSSSSTPSFPSSQSNSDMSNQSTEPSTPCALAVL